MSVRDYLMSQTAPTPIYDETVAALGYDPQGSALLHSLLYHRERAQAPRVGVKPQRPRKRGGR